MKSKLFYLLLIIAFAFVSCSSDRDELDYEPEVEIGEGAESEEENTDDNEDAEGEETEETEEPEETEENEESKDDDKNGFGNDSVYNVQFNISNLPSSTKNSSIIGEYYKRYILQYVLYKENGDTLFAHVSGQEVVPANLEIKRKITPGRYTFAVGFTNQYLRTSRIWTISNLETDYCYGHALTMGGGNVNQIYFESVVIDVDNDDESLQVFDLRLQQMGELMSSIRLDITNLDSYNYPQPSTSENHLLVGYRITTAHSEFGIKSKDVLKKERTLLSSPGTSTTISVQRLMDNGGVWDLPQIYGTTDAKIELIFIEHGPYVAGAIVRAETIYEGVIEKNKRLAFTGNLGQATNFTKREW
ncbi:hypothetical protein [Dysgonomonas sp. 25]|uniref:hypothetical protein n=1 Tax=Dysgonomonas sp. 25 TaxID=2302933 RepID=UPI0013D282BF|nr:hypothetical protein [Dysgonomonas sp. 25]NDV67312.1 hypothetical protein [Dysgonomonas sp. 25]